MVTENFSTVAANVFSGFFSTAYGSSISYNIALVSNTIKFTILIWTSNASELWFRTSFPHRDYYPATIIYYQLN